MRRTRSFYGIRPTVTLEPARLGRLGDLPLVDGVSFTNNDAYNDFINGVTLHGSAGKWSPVSTSLISQANAMIRDANASGNIDRITLATQLTDRIAASAQQVQQLQPFGIWGRSDAQDLQYKAAMQALKDALSDTVAQLGALVKQQAAVAAAQKAADDAARKAAADAAAAAQKATQDAAAEAARKAAEAAAVAAQQTSTTALTLNADGSITATPIRATPKWAIFGGGALLLGGLAYAFSRKRK
jgi:hypothetical protein